ncbi:McrC family protein [Acinetobacter sp. YH01003]|uniref:McrC family protein n=1 Tax=Acinetobacter sp. YH01003 TaxID=2601019 RepID=UPI0015D0D41E|nr:McrC family protein [Acinetobacter sp. YH01003]
MPDFTVREYAYISIVYEGCPKSCLEHAYIPEKAFEYLCGLSASFSKHGAKVFELAGRRKLKLDQFVGVIETPCGTRIEILPKHIVVDEDQQVEDVVQKERRLLQAMLRTALDLNYREAGEASLNKFVQPLHEWIIRQFLKCFESLVQWGLRFDYNSVQEDQKFLRGQLQHARYMRQPPSQRHIFPIEHDVYEVNRPENRLIRTALEVVCKKTKDAANWKLAQELRLMTSEIPKSKNIQHDFRQWQSGRLLALYEQIKPWTELILGEYMPVSTQGVAQGMSLLFPMERLFEVYVGRKMQRLLPEWNVSLQKQDRYMCEQDGRSMFKLKPDIFMQHKFGQSLKVVDTKWKLLDQLDRTAKFGIKDSDMQQMFAYSAYYLGLEHEVVMIYPARKGMFDQALPVMKFKHGNSKLRVIPFDLDGSLEGKHFSFIKALIY